MPRFFEWTPNDAPGALRDVTGEEGWNYIRDFYAPSDPARGGEGTTNAPLERVIQIAKEHGVKAVLIERRYIDLDYRSEHTYFYSTTFRRYPSVSHRLHFFSEVLPADLSTLPGMVDAYKGYSVMRPLPGSPVGRTMIAPPPELKNAPQCSAEDTVHLFGWPFSVRAMPFISQDAQYLRCAHAALWMVLYHAYLAGHSPRRLPHEIHDAAMGGDVVGRQVPSEGLSIAQMLNALHRLELSSGRLKLPPSREESRDADRLSLFAILCRYVNSHMPPIVHSQTHVWVVPAYIRAEPGVGHDRIILYKHDDAMGPYIRVENPWEAGPTGDPVWLGAFPPLPRKFYLTAERAELLGRMAIGRRARSIGGGNSVETALDNDDLTFRTYAIPAHTFKSTLEGRVPREIELLYRFANWPRFVWVIEAVLRPNRDAAAPDVLGEVLIDPTADHLSIRADNTVLGVHLAGNAFIVTPDYGRRRVAVVDDPGAYRSACPAGAGAPEVL